MKNFQKKGGTLRVLQSVPVLMLLAALVLFFAYSMVGLISKLRETSKNKQTAEDQITELQENKEKLSLNIAKLSTEEGVEESIREKFGLVKEGEGVIVIVEDKNPPETPVESESSGFFSFFTKWFK